MATGQFDDEMRGVLFKNKDKTPGDKRPDYNGHAVILGVKVRQAAWLRKSSKTGETFMSIAYEVQDANVTQPPPSQAAPAPTQAPPPVAPTPDEDIPF